jgi:DNA-directed RNA polymerase specialized sigma24 family protein
VTGVTMRPWEEELEHPFRTRYPMLYRTAYSMLGNAADAEDVPQTIFVRLLRRDLLLDLRQNPAGEHLNVTIVGLDRFQC